MNQEQVAQAFDRHIRELHNADFNVCRDAVCLQANLVETRMHLEANLVETRMHLAFTLDLIERLRAVLSEMDDYPGWAGGQ